MSYEIDLLAEGCASEEAIQILELSRQIGEGSGVLDEIAALCSIVSEFEAVPEYLFTTT